MCILLLNLMRTHVSLTSNNGKTPRQILCGTIPYHHQDISTRNIIKVFDLRKMRVQLYLALKNARCSLDCQEQKCSHSKQLPGDICIKIARLLTLDFLAQPARNTTASQQTEARTHVQEAMPATPLTPPRPVVIPDQEPTEETAPASTVAGSAIIQQLYSLYRALLGKRQ